MMNNLPNEIKHPICSFLEINQLGHLARVSKSWQKLANNACEKKLKSKQNVSYKLKLNHALVDACEANETALLQNYITIGAPSS